MCEWYILEELFAVEIMTDMLQSCSQYHPASEIDYPVNAGSAEPIQVMSHCWEERDPYWKMNQTSKLFDINLYFILSEPQKVCV